MALEHRDEDPDDEVGQIEPDDDVGRDPEGFLGEDPEVEETDRDLGQGEDAEVDGFVKVVDLFFPRQRFIAPSLATTNGERTYRMRVMLSKGTLHISRPRPRSATVAHVNLGTSASLSNYSGVYIRTAERTVSGITNIYKIH